MGIELSQEEAKEIQLGILKKVHDFCVRHGMRYSLGGGTLLGAVRHKGYIPWDDDIDIMLPRPDYERLIREFHDDNLVVQDLYTDKHYYLLLSKIYDKRTTFTQNGYRGGVFIDVFPIDGLPEESKAIEFLNKQNKIKKQIWRATKTYQFGDNKLLGVIKYVLRQVVYCFPNRKKLIQEYEALYSQYDFDTSAFAGAITGPYGMKEFMDASVFKEYISLPFEKYDFHCIKAYDAYLTKHYGDYMQLPPKEQQVPHHIEHIYWKK